WPGSDRCVPRLRPAFLRLPSSRIFNVKRLFNATINSLRAIGYGFRREAALREEIIALLAGLIAVVFIAPTVAWYMAMIASLLGLLAVEFRSVTAATGPRSGQPQGGRAHGAARQTKCLVRAVLLQNAFH